MASKLFIASQGCTIVLNDDGKLIKIKGAPSLKKTFVVSTDDGTEYPGTLMYAHSQDLVDELTYTLRCTGGKMVINIGPSDDENSSVAVTDAPFVVSEQSTGKWQKN
ncbi:hypothetical protein FRC07_007889 [Ceratobasidium sp. 392]|nr:hypothetical protein FRC07_007889 [Ceratobasidium sp. 392]